MMGFDTIPDHEGLHDRRLSAANAELMHSIARIKTV